MLDYNTQHHLFCLRKMHDSMVKHWDRPKTNQIAEPQHLLKEVEGSEFFLNFSRTVYCYCYGGATNTRDNCHEFS